MEPVLPRDCLGCVVVAASAGLMGVRERRISEGVGEGGGAGSAHRLALVISWSRGVVGVLV